MSDMRDTVLSSLAAVGANNEAKFYADLFARQDPERFAMIVIDPRCLKDPLLEALVNDLRILSNLQLAPILLIGALDEDRTSIKFQSQRLARDLEQSGVKTAKLNTATYALIPEIRKIARSSKIVILEMTERRGRMSLSQLVKDIKPNKIIFLQPSGGLSEDGERRRNLTIQDLPELMTKQIFSAGQINFLQNVIELDRQAETRRSYIIASPLNLLPELFTTKGSGTLIRREISIKRIKSFRQIGKAKLTKSINKAFGKNVDAAFFKRDLFQGFVESDLRGGALFTQMAGLPYLSKFWVLQEARGEGIARDLWDAMCADVPSFFWRSRMDNPFNDWYMRHCDGMQISGEWRVFWKGLDAPEIPSAIIAAASAPNDFKEE
ncbi:hypothetical protein ACJ3XI_06455 [Litorimonas sp. RW-G-Af-16]|uniref:hypothetical protein n=1 Tax=Litorimonas sp. RW-G-Af-16 TaxID=3241168 RepID=UPI00390CAC8B